MTQSTTSKRLIGKIGRTDSLLIRGFITVFCPTFFWRKYYSFAQNQIGIPQKNQKKCATLSFDCDFSKDVEALPKLLDMLSSYNFKVSFACVGKLIEKYPREHAKIIEDGHEIMNHTYTHPWNEELKSYKQFNKLPLKEQRFEIIQCHNVCKELLDYEPVGFRIPHLAVSYTDSIYEILAEIGYKYSSSIIGVKTESFGNPYTVNGITEFPIITCPRHPFQAFDTYHAFRSRITSHKNAKEFYDVFEQLINFKNPNIYINIYFDPQDIALFDNFEKFLNDIGNKMIVKPYKALQRSFEEGDFEKK